MSRCQYTSLLDLLEKNLNIDEYDDQENDDQQQEICEVNDEHSKRQDNDDDEIDMLGSFCVWLKVKTYSSGGGGTRKNAKKEQEEEEQDHEDDESTTTTAQSKRPRRQRKPRADKARTVLYYGPVKEVPQDRSAAIIIGGFVKLQEALKFAESWITKTRGPIGRLLQALRLLRELPHNHMFIECPLLFQVNPAHWYFIIEDGNIDIARVPPPPRL